MECVKCDKCGLIGEGRLWDRKLAGWCEIYFRIPESRRELTVNYCKECTKDVFARLHIREEDMRGDD